jgi:hypothetical protein
MMGFGKIGTYFPEFRGGDLSEILGSRFATAKRLHAQHEAARDGSEAGGAPKMLVLVSYNA